MNKRTDKGMNERMNRIIFSAISW